MSNSITLAERFLPILDGVYKAESKTAILEGANRNIRFLGGNAVEIFKTAMDGLADYSRENGFVKGSVTSGWDKYTLSKDRGVELDVDAMDNEETLGMAFGTLASEFVRTKEVPELDAYRFAAMASATGVSGTSADLSAAAATIAAIDTATVAMDDDEVPYEGRILFVSPTIYGLIKGGVTRMVMNRDKDVNYNVDMYNDMRVITVPQARFNTAITLYDGTSNFGYAVPAGSYKINFMVVHPSAVLPVVKHEIPRIFAPNVNQSADAWKFQLRLYHDCFVLKNKVKGIYVHKKSTANS